MVKKYGEVGTAEERINALIEWRKTIRDNRGMFHAIVMKAEQTEEV